MTRFKLAFVTALVALTLAACSGTTEVEADLSPGLPILPEPAVESSTSSETSDLASFFNDDDTDAAPLLTVPDPEPTAREVDAPTPEDADLPDISDDIQDREVEEVEDVGGASITAEPVSFDVAGEHAITIAGAGFVADDEVSVLVCQLPGDPISFDTTSEDLVNRLTEVSAVEICDVARAVNVPADADGTFSLPLTVDVGATTIVFAGPVSGDYATLTPLYLVG